MRKLLIAMMLLALPLFAPASSTTAVAATPAPMTLIDKLATPSLVEKAACHYRCYRVCAKRNYHGHCVYWKRHCHRVCYRPRYHRYH